jgi:hypothetical protein
VARLAGAVAGALAVLSLVPNLAVGAPLAVPSFFSSGVGDVVPAGSTVLVAPYSHDGLSAQPMVWQAWSGMAFRMPEGYFVNVDARGARRDGPRQSFTGDLMVRIQRGEAVDLAGIDLARVRADLRAWRVRAVVVGPMPYRDRMAALFARVLARAPEARGDVLVWRDASR